MPAGLRPPTAVRFDHGIVESRGYGDNRHGGQDRGGRTGYGGRDGRNREYDRRSGTGRFVPLIIFVVRLLRHILEHQLYLPQLPALPLLPSMPTLMFLSLASCLFCAIPGIYHGYVRSAFLSAVLLDIL